MSTTKIAFFIRQACGTNIARLNGLTASSTNCQAIAAQRLAHKVAKRDNPKIEERDIHVAFSKTLPDRRELWTAEWEQKEKTK